MSLRARRIKHAGRLSLWLGIALCALLSSACDSTSGPDSIPSGGYAYTGLDSDGGVVVRGWLTLDVSNPASVTGSWHLEAQGNPQNIGPQTGDGQLAGSMSPGALNLNLNPGQVDNNVFLQGTLESGAFRGRWTYSNFVGAANQGTFEALQR